jgi:protein-S-isoprenylcysteine O-methyltransferase Ste14
MGHDAAIGVEGLRRWDGEPGGHPRLLRRVFTLRLLGWDPGDVLARIFVGALFFFLAIRIAENSLQTGRVTGLLLVASEGLVVVLMIIRRPSSDVDRAWTARLITMLSMVGPPLVRPLPTQAGGADVATAVVSALGLALVVVSKLALGRSFGLVPANRGVVSSGPYRLVRHPIYLGYLVTHVAFVVANPLAWNLCILGAADVALLTRAVYEERTLERDQAYVAYEARVRWRIVPRVF